MTGPGPEPEPARESARNREQTSQRLLTAVGQVLARDGFAALGVNAVAREAGVDKVLIYRYFGGLSELLAAWGASGRFWPRVDELVAREPGLLELPAAERYARFLSHFIDELRARPLTLEVLAAEVQHRNQLTAVLEAEREAWGEQAFRVVGGPAFARQPHLRALTLLLVGGVMYLLLRSRSIRLFGGLNLHDDAAWAELKAAVRAMALQMLSAEA